MQNFADLDQDLRCNRTGIIIDTHVALDVAALVRYGQEARFTLRAWTGHRAHIRSLGRKRHLRENTTSSSGLASSSLPSFERIYAESAAPRRRSSFGMDTPAVMACFRWSFLENVIPFFVSTPTTCRYKVAGFSLIIKKPFQLPARFRNADPLMYYIPVEQAAMNDPGSGRSEPCAIAQLKMR